jgi:methionine-rich copper-binding protein CopC
MAGGYNTIKMNKLSGGKYYGSFEKREGAERYQVIIRAYGITENAARYDLSFNPDEIKSDTPEEPEEEPQDDRKDVSTLDSRYYLSKAIYTGRELTPVFVKDGDTILTEGVDYTISYTDNVNAGKGRFTITGIGKYKGTKTGSFTIRKATNSILVSVQTVTVSYSKLKKQTQGATIKASVSGENAKASFKLLSVPKAAKKYISLTTAGKIKIKKGISKGSYTVKFRVTSEETSNYAESYIDKSIRVIVK